MSAQRLPPSRPGEVLPDRIESGNSAQARRATEAATVRLGQRENANGYERAGVAAAWACGAVSRALGCEREGQLAVNFQV